MRDGGWRKERNTVTDFYKTKSQMKASQELGRTQSISSRKLSEPKRRADNYLFKLEEMRKTFHS